MAFADFEWATDTNYPAGSETWSATPVKVAPSAGVQADGFAPTDRPPAQWINWLFNGIVTAGQALETAVGDGSLQHAWERSEFLGSSTPHLDITGSYLRVGAAIPAIPMIVVNEAGGDVFFGADLDLYTGKTLTLPSAAALLVTGAGAGGRPKALIQTSGVGGETNLESGSFTPTIDSVSGTGVGPTTGDVSSPTGRYQRIGQTVFYTMRFLLDTTSWSGVCSVRFDLPVSGTISGVMHGVIDPGRPGDAGDYFTFLSVSSSAFQVNITPGSSKGSGLALNVSGSYRLA